MFTILLSVFYYIISPCADMRVEADEKSELVSQACFSEEINVLEENDKWAKVQTVVDNYQGWMKKENFCKRNDSFFFDTNKIIKINRTSAHLYAAEDTIFGPVITLPFGSRLRLVEFGENSGRWVKVEFPDNRQAFVQFGDIVFGNSQIDREEMCRLSHNFIGLPYTWGGRTSFGYDCSGFVQMLYAQMGICLPRDSKDQVKYEKLKPVKIEELKPGDLVFFGYSSSKICHVGIFLGNDEFIHSTIFGESKKEGQTVGDLFIHSTIAENKPYIHISKLSDPDWNGTGKFSFRQARTIASQPK